MTSCRGYFCILTASHFGTQPPSNGTQPRRIFDYCVPKEKRPSPSPWHDPTLTLFAQFWCCPGLNFGPALVVIPALSLVNCPPTCPLTILCPILLCPAISLALHCPALAPALSSTITCPPPLCLICCPLSYLCPRSREYRTRQRTNALTRTSTCGRSGIFC